MASTIAGGEVGERSIGVAAPLTSDLQRVSWGAIFTGVVVALAIQVVLAMLGISTGEVVADLNALWSGHDLPYVPELIAAKRLGEHARSDGVVDPARLAADVERLGATLTSAAEDSSLPEQPSAGDALHDLVVRVRLAR